jgi:hypothetical protein
VTNKNEDTNSCKRCRLPRVLLLSLIPLRLRPLPSGPALAHDDCTVEIPI